MLHTDGSKAHCYCYTSDAVLGLLKILLEGEPGRRIMSQRRHLFYHPRDGSDAGGGIPGIRFQTGIRYPKGCQPLRIRPVFQDAGEFRKAPVSGLEAPGKPVWNVPAADGEHEGLERVPGRAAAVTVSEKSGGGGQPEKERRRQQMEAGKKYADSPVWEQLSGRRILLME